MLFDDECPVPSLLAAHALLPLFIVMSLLSAGCADDAVEPVPQGGAEERSERADSADAASPSGDPVRDDSDAGSVLPEDQAGFESDGSADDEPAPSDHEDAGDGEPDSSPDPNPDTDLDDPGADEDSDDLTPAEPLRIVPIGDSITQGRLGDGSFDSSNGSTLSYRYVLWKLLVDAGIEVDFVGSQRDGFGGSPAWEDYRGLAFDRDHEGHWGWRLDDIRDSLGPWLQGYEADIALIMLGTNDASAGEDVSQMLEEAADIFAILREANPSIVIIWGHAFQEWEPFPAFREAMQALASEQSTALSPIITVDPSDGWVSDPSAPGSHTLDWVHPNLRGDQKLAEAFYEALLDWL